MTSAFVAQMVRVLQHHLTRFLGIWGGVEGALVGPYCAMIALATL